MFPTVLLQTALAATVPSTATPPSIDTPIETGDKAKKDSALIIAMEDYATLPDLPGVSEDVRAMQDFLIHTRGIPEERVRVASNSSRGEIVHALQAAAADAKKKGTLWIYFVGYGTTDEKGNRLLLGKKATAEAPDTDALPLGEVVSGLNSTKASQIVVVVDANFAGADRAGNAVIRASVPPNPLAAPANAHLALWLSGAGTELSPYYAEAAHGLFSYLVVGALRGWADGANNSNPDRKISLVEAQQYVYKTERQLAGPDVKPSRESRAEVNAFVLSNASVLEAGPDAALLTELARIERIKRVERAQAVLQKVANADWEAVQKALAVPGADINKILGDFVAKYDSATVSVDGAEVAVLVPQVAEARATLDEMARKAAAGKKKKRKSRKKAPPVTPPQSYGQACADLSALQSIALGGQLTDEQRSCLEDRLLADKVQTNRDKSSRLLLIDADARGDDAAWLSLAERHLEEIDRSDPDICFKYALRLSRGGLEDAEEVLKWADVALENKHVWEGPLYTSRVYNLYRLKAETALRMWNDAEQDYVADRNSDNEAISETLRGQAKNFAREWLDYARSSGQPWDRAYELCLSASGNEAFCPSG